MRVFVLEDSEERIRKFEELFKEDALRIARTSQEGIDILASYYDYNNNEWLFEWDYVFLDHDLGYDEDRRSFDEGTGMEVARYIVQTRPRIKHIIIHSWNTDGAKAMMSGLNSVGYTVSRIPFNPEL